MAGSNQRFMAHFLHYDLILLISVTMSFDLESLRIIPKYLLWALLTDTFHNVQQITCLFTLHFPQ